MRADIHDGQENKRSMQGPDTEAQDHPPFVQIRLATHGRSIQTCHERKCGLGNRSKFFQPNFPSETGSLRMVGHSFIAGFAIAFRLFAQFIWGAREDDGQPNAPQDRRDSRRRCRGLQPPCGHRRGPHACTAEGALRSDLIDPTIAVYKGRVVKRTGDGALVEFSSVVDAVRCAIEVQNGMVERNAGLPPERRIEFRIGIHLGDVVEESDGDLMGDSVNIAARLEGIAKAGAICLSEDAYRQVKARLDLVVADLGEQNLKNIAEPIRAYSLEVGKSASAKPD